MPEKEQKLAELVNEVRRLRVEKAEVMKGWKEAIDAAQGKVDALALEITSGQKSLFDGPEGGIIDALDSNQ
jgi:hypothetical protein